MFGKKTSGRQAMSAIHLLHRAGQCADELFMLNVSDQQLTPRQYTVLESVAFCDREPSQTALVEMTGIDRSTLADIVRRLVDRGLLTRMKTRSDARMYAVRLTLAGEAALAAVSKTVALVEEQLFATVPEGERPIIREVLERIVAAHGPISSARVSARTVSLSHHLVEPNDADT